MRVPRERCAGVEAGPCRFAALHRIREGAVDTPVEPSHHALAPARGIGSTWEMAEMQKLYAPETNRRGAERMARRDNHTERLQSSSGQRGRAGRLDEDSLRAYMREIQPFNPLSAEEEVVLAQRIEADDQIATSEHRAAGYAVRRASR